MAVRHRAVNNPFASGAGGNRRIQYSSDSRHVPQQTKLPGKNRGLVKTVVLVAFLLVIVYIMYSRTGASPDPSHDLAAKTEEADGGDANNPDGGASRDSKDMSPDEGGAGSPDGANSKGDASDPNGRAGPRPADGPATLFEADSHVATLVALRHPDKDLAKFESPDEYGLVMVAGWPPAGNTKSCYHEFLKLVRKCFDHVDLHHGGGEEKSYAAYLYPSQYLHVTVATLHSIHNPTYGDAKRRTLLKQHWTDILLTASGRPEWPTQPLKLTIDSAQIGKRAGILLWRELTGGLDQMRLCIRQETTQRQEELEAVGIDAETLSIPTIIHSTFLRFHRVPETKGESVQGRFQEFVSPRLKELFPSTIVLDDAKLVCERTPYMHIPNDAHHVFETFFLQRGGN